MTAPSSPLSTALGQPGQPVRCRVIGDDIAIHWWDHWWPGRPCMCGATTAKRDHDQEDQP